MSCCCHPRPNPKHRTYPSAAPAWGRWQLRWKPFFFLERDNIMRVGLRIVVRNEDGIVFVALTTRETQRWEHTSLKAKLRLVSLSQSRRSFGHERNPCTLVRAHTHTLTQFPQTVAKYSARGATSYCECLGHDTVPWYRSADEDERAALLQRAVRSYLARGRFCRAPR